MAEVRTRDGVWTFDEEVVRIVPGHDRKVHKLRRALGERAVPVAAIAGVAFEEGRKGGVLRLRLREGADPFLHVTTGGLTDAADPYSLRVPRDAVASAEWFVDELRHELGPDAATATDRFLLPAPATPLSATAGDGTVSFDGSRIRIEWTEWADGPKEDAAPTELAIDAVEGVEWTPIVGLTNGHLRFLVPGAVAKSPDRDLHCLSWGILREGGTTSLLAAAVVARLPHPNAPAGPAGPAAPQLDPGRPADTGATDVPEAPQVPAPAPPVDGTGAEQDDVLRRLRELGALHRDGVLTDDEFATAKRALLGRF